MIYDNNPLLSARLCNETVDYVENSNLFDQTYRRNGNTAIENFTIKKPLFPKTDDKITNSSSDLMIDPWMLFYLAMIFKLLLFLVTFMEKNVFFIGGIPTRGVLTVYLILF